jgi:hypothetical protein
MNTSRVRIAKRSAAVYKPEPLAGSESGACEPGRAVIEEEPLSTAIIASPPVQVAGADAPTFEVLGWRVRATAAKMQSRGSIGTRKRTSLTGPAVTTK